VFDSSALQSIACEALEARIAVLASGVGTNLQALLDDPIVGAWITLVVSDKPQAGALEKARARGVETVFVDPDGFEDRRSFDDAVMALLDRAGTEYVVLAGFMRVLGPEFVHAYEGRMLNIHPSLLPKFPGTHAVQDALEAGVERTGVTIHFVDEQVDHGPVVMQEEVPVLPDDDVGSLEARVHEVEHRLYPQAVRALVEGLKPGEAAS